MSVKSQSKAELNAASAAVVQILSPPEPIRAPRCQLVRDKDGSFRVVLCDQPHANAAPGILSEYFEKNELAVALDRNPRTIDRWHLLGTGPPRTLVGRKVYYKRASVERWLAAQEQSPTV